MNKTKSRLKQMLETKKMDNKFAYYNITLLLIAGGTYAISVYNILFFIPCLHSNHNKRLFVVNSFATLLTGSIFCNIFFKKIVN